MSFSKIIYHIKWIVLVGFLLCLYDAFQDVINRWVASNWIGQLCHVLNDAFIESMLLLVFGVAMVVSFLICQLTKIKELTCQGFFIQLFICGAVEILLLDDYWLYPDIIEGTMNLKTLWQILFTIFGILLVAIYLYFVVRRGRLKTPSFEVKRGFTSDHNQNTEEKVSSYAKSLADRLLQTNVEEESFSIGLAGQWGSGKTTYLNALKAELQDYAICIDFLPWNSLSADKIVEDFFLLFRKEVARFIDPSIGRAVTLYSRYLLSVNRMDPWLAMLRSLAIWHSEEDAHTFKTKVATILQRCNNKIVVTIDDIDRLEADELFEVLRLIRNTANLPNLFYIVTYDKEYVVAQLEHKGISNPMLYLEKIFNVEVMLPKVLNYDLRDLFWKDLREMVDDDIYLKVKSAFVSIPGSKRSLVLTDLLPNYREIKRFARQFAANVTYAVNNLKQEILVEDLFCVEVIRYLDFDFYMRMRNDMETIFTVGGGDLKRISVKYEAGNENKAFLEHYTNERVAAVVKNLFKKDRSKVQSIVFANNYSRYFFWGVEKQKMYSYDLEELLKIADHDQQCDSLKTYFENEKENDNYDVGSLTFLISQIDYRKPLSVDRAKSLASLLLTLTKYCPFVDLFEYLSLVVKQLHGLDQQNRTYIHWFIKRFAESGAAKGTSGTLSFIRDFYNHYHYEDTEQEILHLMADVFTEWAETNKPDAVDIINPNSELRKVFEMICYTIEEEEVIGYSQDVSTVCLIKDVFLTYFSQNRSDRYEKFDEYFESKLTDEERSLGVDPCEKEEVAAYRLTSIFGETSNLYEEYRDTCFSDRQFSYKA